MSGLAYLSTNKSGHLTISGVDAVNLAEKYGTPLYVYSADIIKQRYRKAHETLTKKYPNSLICYAYKANTILTVCKLLREEGAGAEVVSGGELYAALKAGVPPERIVFDGVSKSLNELEMAIDAGVAIINVESSDELNQLNKLCQERGCKVSVGIRVNPNVPSLTHRYIMTGVSGDKFGLDLREAFEAYKEALDMDHIMVKGLHAHIGSQIVNLTPFKQEIEKLISLLISLKDKLNISIEYLNVGGGLGIKYKPSDRELSIDEFVLVFTKKIKQKIKETGLKMPMLFFELGRWIVGPAGVLLSKVNYVKNVWGTKWILLDAGMTDFIRPALYGAQHLMLVANKARERREETYSVGGPICESSDVFANNVMLPRVTRGDFMVILDVGAYGQSMSSQYNMRPRAAAVMINQGLDYLVRRREKYEDLFNQDLM